MKIEQTILNGNKLIAEFMGAEFKDNWDNQGDTYIFKKKPTITSSYYWSPEELQYHSSWSWLMPVIEKIEKKGWYFDIKQNIVTISNNTSSSEPIWFGGRTSDSKIISCWYGVIGFIEWYNTGKVC